MFLKRYDLLEKFPISYQKLYLEQKCITLLNLVDNHYGKYYNNTSVISRWGANSPILSLVILFLVLPSNFIVSGVKCSRVYPSLILNVILFSVLFIYICTDGLSISSPCFFKIYQNNLEYLIWNKIHLVTQIHHSMLVLIF